MDEWNVIAFYQAIEKVAFPGFSRFTVAEDEGDLRLNLALLDFVMDCGQELASRFIAPGREPTYLVGDMTSPP